MVKIAKYKGFCVYRRSYLIWPPVILIFTARNVWISPRSDAAAGGGYQPIWSNLHDICLVSGTVDKRRPDRAITQQKSCASPTPEKQKPPA